MVHALARSRLGRRPGAGFPAADRKRSTLSDIDPKSLVQPAVRSFSTSSSPALYGPDAPAFMAGFASGRKLPPAAGPAGRGQQSAPSRFGDRGVAVERRARGFTHLPRAGGPKRGGPDRALGRPQKRARSAGKATAPLAPGPIQDTGQTLAPFNPPALSVN